MSDITLAFVVRDISVSVQINLAEGVCTVAAVDPDGSRISFSQRISVPAAPPVESAAPEEVVPRPAPPSDARISAERRLFATQCGRRAQARIAGGRFEVTAPRPNRASEVWVVLRDREGRLLDPATVSTRWQRVRSLVQESGSSELAPLAVHQGFPSLTEAGCYVVAAGHQRPERIL